MASRLWQRMMGLVPKQIIIAGSFRPAGTGAVTNVTGYGVASVARSGVGVYLITLDDSYPELVAGVCGMREAAGTGTTVQLGDYTAGTTGATLQIRTYQESTNALTLTDLAADADNTVNFILCFRNGVSAQTGTGS